VFSAAMDTVTSAMLSAMAQEGGMAFAQKSMTIA
jgi:IMP dehydrogenase/GMP reductase